MTASTTSRELKSIPNRWETPEAIEPRSDDQERQRLTQAPTVAPARDASQDIQGAGLDPGQTASSPEPKLDTLHERLERVERQNRWLRYGFVILFGAMAYLAIQRYLPENIIVRQTLMESEELKLVDPSGNTRMFVRMYSRVPVLQLLDKSGKARMSMGLRFDDTPFLNLADRTGRTRASFEMNEQDEPTLRIFDRSGNPTFKIN
jgi:hypothetical protein